MAPPTTLPPPPPAMRRAAPECRPFGQIMDAYQEWPAEAVQRAIRTLTEQRRTIDAANVGEVIEPLETGEPRHNGYTEREWCEIMDVVRSVGRRAMAREIAEVRAFAWFYSAAEAKDIIDTQLETIQGQQRVILSLLAYIETLEPARKQA